VASAPSVPPGTTGSAPQPALDLLAFQGWLHAVANRLLGWDHPDHDDLVQEGYIAMWRASRAHDPARGSLTAWVIRAAELRMRDLAWGHGQPTGHQALRGTRAVTVAMHLDELASDLRSQLEPIAEDVAEAAMWAYHHGEVLAAMDRLTHHQRTAVLHVLSDGLLTGAQRANLQAARRHLRQWLEHLKD
jgi:DNA-directed RNA polymerase specialized sigma24 family protein